MTLTEIEHLAELACIALEAGEKERLGHELGAILDYVGELRAVDAGSTEPLIHLLPLFNVYREDVVKESPRRDEVLANAPLIEDGHYRVPRIL